MKPLNKSQARALARWRDYMVNAGVEWLAELEPTTVLELRWVNGRVEDNAYCVDLEAKITDTVADYVSDWTHVNTACVGPRGRLLGFPKCQKTGSNQPGGRGGLGRQPKRGKDNGP